MYIYIYIHIHLGSRDPAAGHVHGLQGPASTANLRTEMLDFGGFDSSIILTLRGGIPRPLGNFLESLSQAILVGITLVGRLGVVKPLLQRGRRWRPGKRESIDRERSHPDLSGSGRAFDRDPGVRTVDVDICLRLCLYASSSQ